MRARNLFATAVLALLAVATFVDGAAGPLHEIEALRGHEHCADGGDGTSFRHVCHDENGCTICGLVGLPTITESSPPPPPACEAVIEAPAALPDVVLGVVAPYAAPARAPPVL